MASASDLLTRIVISAEDKASGVIGKIAGGMAAAARNSQSWRAALVAGRGGAE